MILCLSSGDVLKQCEVQVAVSRDLLQQAQDKQPIALCPCGHSPT